MRESMNVDTDIDMDMNMDYSQRILWLISQRQSTAREKNSSSRLPAVVNFQQVPTCPENANFFV
jgi:hypothetical protein